MTIERMRRLSKQDLALAEAWEDYRAAKIVSFRVCCPCIEAELDRAKAALLAAFGESEESKVKS